MMLCVELLAAAASSGWISLHLAGSVQGLSFYWFSFYWLLLWCFPMEHSYDGNSNQA